MRRWGRWRLPTPLPRAALSARREATAVGGFVGICSGDFGGGGASGTSALVSSARLAGPLESDPGGRTCPRSMCWRRLTGTGGAWGRAGCRGVDWAGCTGCGSLDPGLTLAGVRGFGVGAAAGGSGPGWGGSWGQNRLV